jgi:hypothetical protein
LLRGLIINPIVIALLAGCGVALCRLAGFNPHLSDMALAAVVVLVGSEMALMPLVLTRGASQLAVTQAGLIATLVHLFLIVALGALTSFSMHLSQPFNYWALAFYWPTLAVVSLMSIKAIREATVASTPASTKH